MDESQDEILDNQTEKSVKPELADPPASPVNDQNGKDPLQDEENEVDEENVPVPPQFESPYFPNGVYEDAPQPEKDRIRYDPFAAQTDAEDKPDSGPKRKTRVILGVIALALIAALVYAVVTGRLVMPF